MKLYPKEQISKKLEAMDLPSQVMGTSMMEVFGNRQILLFGQKGIRLYEAQEIIVEMNDYAVDIVGTALHIVSMNAKEIMIRGTIDHLRFIL